MTAKQPSLRLAFPFTLALAMCAIAAAMIFSLTPATMHRVSSAASTPFLHHVKQSAQGSQSPAQQRFLAAYGRRAMDFERNQGQTDAAVKYLAHGKGYTLFLTSSDAVFAFPVSQKSDNSQLGVRAMLMHKRMGLNRALKLMRGSHHAAESNSAVATLKMHMRGASPTEITGENEQASKTNYLIGNDPRNWHTHVSHFADVRYRQIYPGVDAVFHGGVKPEFDYVVGPGTDPAQIALELQGAEKVCQQNGDLVIAVGDGEVRLQKPLAYQEKNGQRQLVDASFVLRANHTVGFALGNYDRSRQLVIDPAYTYSTYLGGTLEDEGLGISVTSGGSAFVTGETDSATFPGPSGGSVTKLGPRGGFDVFVTELDTNGVIVFTTILGGSADDAGIAITQDSTGIYVAGGTDSSDFPVSSGAVQKNFLGGTIGGDTDGFLVKLAPNGASIMWATYVAGDQADVCLGVAVDGSQNVYLAGDTFSNNLGGNTGGVNPVGGFGSLNLGAGESGADDGYLAKVKSDGSSYLSLTYIGGSDGDLTTGVVVDAGGNVYLSGETISADLPVTSSAFQTQCGTDGNCNFDGSNLFDDAFVATVPSSLTDFHYVTYLGGESVDDGLGVAVDSSGNVSVTGLTESTQFPTQMPFQGSLIGLPNVFATRFNSAGDGLTYSTYLGGTSSDVGVGIVLDPTGNNAFITGATTSSDFPVSMTTQPSFGGGNITGDAFISELSWSGTNLSLPFSTFLGGSGDEDEIGGAVGLDSSNNVYATGDTNSSNFPTVAAAEGTYSSGNNCNLPGGTVPCPDAFVTKISLGQSTATYTITVGASTATVTHGQSTSPITVTLTPVAGFSGTVNLSCSGLPAQANCVFTPPQLAISGSAQTSQLVISTTAMSAALPPDSKGIGLVYGMLLVPGLALIGAGFDQKRSRKKKLLGVLLACMLFAGMLLMPACGGGGSSSGSGTPPGTYNVTVKGSGTGIPSVNGTPLKLVVN